MDKLLVTVPDQIRSKGDDSVETDPKQVEVWLSSLPTERIAETVHQLDTAITTLNEADLSDSKRASLLKVFHNGFESILQGYDELRLKQLRTSEAERHKLADSIMWLYIKLSHGYKILVKHGFDSKEDPKQTQPLLLAIFRSLELTGLSLLYAYRCSTRTPPLVNQELNQLYAYAEYHNVQDRNIASAKGYAKTPTIGSFYKLTILMGLIDVSELEHGMAESLFYALQGFANAAYLSHEAPPLHNKYKYLVNLYEDAWPHPYTEECKISNAQYTRHFCADPLVTKVEAWLEANKDCSDFVIAQECEILRSYLTQLKTSRDKSIIEIKLKKEQRREARKVKLIVGFLPIECLLITKIAGVEINLDYELTEWTKHNETSSSCKLVSEIDKQTAPLSIGDFAALVTTNDLHEKVNIENLALIQKIQLLEHDKLGVTLEYLTDNAIPITYSTTNSQEGIPNTRKFSGIYIPEEPISGKPAYLILEKRHYYEKQEYAMTMDETDYKLRLETIERKTIKYVFCKINQIERQDKAA